MVYSDGTNKWMSPATFKSSCDMRVKFYPFDKQECKLTFGSWTYDSRLLRMINPAGKYSHSGWLEYQNNQYVMGMQGAQMVQRRVTRLLLLWPGFHSQTCLLFEL